MAPFLFLFFLFLFSLSTFVSAQTSSSSSPSQTPSLSFSLSTGSVTVTFASSRPNTQPTTITTVIPGGVFNVTYTVTPTISTPASASASASPTPDPFVLETRVDPAFSVLGVILILTGLPSAFWGHKNRWTSFFLIGFYTLSLVCIVLILKFGVIPAINPPNKTLRGMFVLSSTVAGIAGGGIAIFFWKGARYAIGAWGGFAFALWIQCFQNGGLIKPVGFRWILYIVCGVLGFALSTIPKIHYHVLLVSTAIAGATSFMLGVDCFTTAGLKEFYVWNLGFPALFPKFVDNGIQFPVSQTMQIELGLTAAVTLMGIAVQLRILKVLQRKMQEIAEETKRQDEEAELRAADRLNDVKLEREAWENDHPTLSKHGRQDSTLSSTMPLMKDRDDSPSPLQRHSSYTQDGPRTRLVSGLSDFKVAPTSDEDLKRASRFVGQTPGTLPTLDLGTRIQEDVPANYISNDSTEISPAELEDLKKKQSLLAEIQSIRRSIDILKSDTPVPPSSSEQSRRPSFASRRTLSLDAGSALFPVPSHARPPREISPRNRVHSLEFSSLAAGGYSSDDHISRPTSVPLKDDDWDLYIQERKLLQPPAGVTPPIATVITPRAPLSPAVQDALQQRKSREGAFGRLPTPSTESSEDVPLARVVQQHKSPVTILPPRRPAATTIVAPTPRSAPPRTRTFEELTERHREKMRDMQAPLTQAEKEHAELEAARQRWERAKALEKEAVTRRQAEKVAALEKKKKTGNAEFGAIPSTKLHSRSLSADKLANQGTSSKRLSTLKVEDWQRYQQDAEMGVKPAGHEGGAWKRDSRNMRSAESVPFPQPGRKSRDL